jgi:hypothetical protein
MRQQIIDLRQEAAQVDQKIQQLGEELPELDLEVRALQPVQHLKTLCAKLAQELQEKEHELHRLYARQTELRETLKACQVYLDRLETGYTDPPQAHIHHQHLPESPGEHRVNRFAVFWAAISSGLLLLGSVTLLFVHPPYWVAGLLILLALFAIIDAMLRRQLEDRLLLVTLGLAILTSAVLIYEFFWLLLFVGVVSLSLMIIRDNMRELRSS